MVENPLLEILHLKIKYDGLCVKQLFFLLWIHKYAYKNIVLFASKYQE